MKNILIIGAGGIGFALAEQLYSQAATKLTLITRKQSLLSDRRFEVLCLAEHSEDETPLHSH